MLMQDTDIQVWLATQASAGQVQMVPYVTSRVGRKLSYRIDVIRQGGHGNRTQISQSGRIELSAATPTELSQLALGSSDDTQCRVDIVLREGVREVGSFHFDCPE